MAISHRGALNPQPWSQRSLLSSRLGLCAADVTSFFSWLPAKLLSLRAAKDDGQSNLQYDAFSPGSERVTSQNPDWLAQRQTTVEIRQTESRLQKKPNRDSPVAVLAVFHTNDGSEEAFVGGSLVPEGKGDD